MQSSSPSLFCYFSNDSLSAHFASIVNSSLPLNLNVFNQIISTTLSRVLQPPIYPFTSSPVTQSDVSNALLLAAFKDRSHDEIYVAMLKLSVETIIPPLTSLFNKFLILGIFPFAWNLIVPLLKKNRPSSISDTRPIAKLSETSKLFERIVHTKLPNTSNREELLTPRQAGFRLSHSNQTALLGVLDDVRHAITKSEAMILLLFDFSKAFDSIAHRILINKLRQLNIGNSIWRNDCRLI